MTDQKIKSLLNDLKHSADRHRTAQKTFGYLFATAELTTSADEAGRRIAASVAEGGDDLIEWISLHSELVNEVLSDWYSAAILHEQKRGATK